MCAQDCMGKVPLAMATLNGRDIVLEALCHYRAPLNLVGNWGATPLTYAQYGRSKAERGQPLKYCVVQELTLICNIEMEEQPCTWLKM